MKTRFFLVDDSYNERHQIITLTGVIVPIEKYAAIRQDLNGRLFDRFDLGIRAHMPELHARALLRAVDPPLPDGVEINDELLHAIFQDVVDLIVGHELRVYRKGYYVPKGSDPLLSKLGLTMISWWGLTGFLEKFELGDGYVIPVMDAGDRDVMKTILHQTTSGHVMEDLLRHSGKDPREALSTSENYRNLVGEVLFADSKYAPFVQIADMASYLLHVEDRDRYGDELTDFKKGLLMVARGLRPRIVADSISVMNFSGEPTGPEKYRHEYCSTIANED